MHDLLSRGASLYDQHWSCANAGIDEVIGHTFLVLRELRRLIYSAVSLSDEKIIRLCRAYYALRDQEATDAPKT